MARIKSNTTSRQVVIALVGVLFLSGLAYAYYHYMYLSDANHLDKSAAAVPTAVTSSKPTVIPAQTTTVTEQVAIVRKSDGLYIVPLSSLSSPTTSFNNFFLPKAEAAAEQKFAPVALDPSSIDQIVLSADGTSLYLLVGSDYQTMRGVKIAGQSSLYKVSSANLTKAEFVMKLGQGVTTGSYVDTIAVNPSDTNILYVQSDNHGSGTILERLDLTHKVFTTAGNGSPTFSPDATKYFTRDYTHGQDVASGGGYGYDELTVHVIKGGSSRAITTDKQEVVAASWISSDLLIYSWGNSLAKRDDPKGPLSLSVIALSSDMSTDFDGGVEVGVSSIVVVPGTDLVFLLYGDAVTPGKINKTVLFNIQNHSQRELGPLNVLTAGTLIHS